MTRVRALVVTGLFWMCGSAAPGRRDSFRSWSLTTHPRRDERLDTAGLGNRHDDSRRGPRIRRSRPAPHRGHGIGSEQGSPAQTLGGKRVTLGDRWGDAPVWCEGIAAEVVLPLPADRVTVYPLDTAGNRRSSVKPTGRDGRAVIAIGPACKTLWYEGNSVETAQDAPAASRLCGCRPAGTEPQRRARFRPEIGHAADQEVPFRLHLAEPVPAGTGTRGTGDILPGPCRTKHFRGFRASAQALGGDHHHRNPSRRA